MQKSNQVPVALLAAILGTAPLSAQEPKPFALEGAEAITFKTVGDHQLQLHVVRPEDWKPTDQRPAIVFFFGGGWVGGTPAQFLPQCRELAQRGMVAITAEYRVNRRHGTTPFDCVADGKSAVRWVRAHADELGVDPKRIAAGGGSAGGHVAACTALIAGGDDPQDDAEVSSLPNALVLFNPVIDCSGNGFGMKRIGERWKEISPLHHVRKGLPPALLFHGTADKTVPFANAEEFAKRMTKAGNRCELLAFDGRGHGFFNPRKKQEKDYAATVGRMVGFLAELGWVGNTK